MLTDYDPHNIQTTVANALFKKKPLNTENKKYILAMFPYPSGQFHMGHARCYTLADTMSKYYQLNGYQVFSPMGWDAFGLPAENAAIKHDKHPKDWTESNITQMREQFDMLGLHFDWAHELKTCDPEYYRWQQWLFIQMYNNGLAYRKKSSVNWDPVDETVLANEQVIDGRGWRSGALVERREIHQWFLKITQYADQLLTGSETLNQWPEQVTLMQKNWIGKSIGVDIHFNVPDLNEVIKVYTTRADTLLGASGIALAPTHPIVKRLIQDNPELAARIKPLEQSGVSEAMIETSEKQGVKLDIHATCPISGKPLMVYCANYVLMDYGHGAVMMCPAHCERDHAFALRYAIPFTPVIASKDHDYSKQAMIEKGTLINSQDLNGLESNEAIKVIAKRLAAQQQGQEKTQFRLRDWGISRQRYWGCPIPMIYCDDCGIVPEKEENLPVMLPTHLKFNQSNQMLKNDPDFLNTTCPKCGKKAKRETDTFDTFFDSSWYYARFLSVHDDKHLLNPAQKNGLPVDMYIGGIEHAILHLLYARFINYFLYDLGITSQQEPFKELLTQGMVLKDGRKMSKSLGNLVTPSELHQTYGADALRLFILFAAPPQQSLEWSNSGIEGMHRFLRKVYQYFSTKPEAIEEKAPQQWAEAQEILQKISHDYQIRQLNTVVAGSMKLFNLISQHTRNQTTEAIERLFLITLFPLAPHISSYLWEGPQPLTETPWPLVDHEAIKHLTKPTIIQINGKKRGALVLDPDLTEAEILSQIQSSEDLSKYLNNQDIKRIIVIKGRLVNIVI